MKHTPLIPAQAGIEGHELGPREFIPDLIGDGDERVRYTLPSSARMKMVRAARRSSFTGFPPAVGSSGAIFTI